MLIFTLTASLIVAFIMNPVFAVDFMNHPEGEHRSKWAIFKKPGLWIGLGIGILLDLAGQTFLGNLLLFIILLVLLNHFVLNDVIHGFQNRVLPALMRRYERLLRWTLKGWRPVYLLIGTILLFFISLFTFYFFSIFWSCANCILSKIRSQLCICVFKRTGRYRC